MARASNPEDEPAYESLEDSLARVEETWTDPDPEVVALPGDGLPAVAVVRGQIRFLSYDVVYPQPCSLARLRDIVLRRGEHHVIRLSDHPAGYRKEMFRLP